MKILENPPTALLIPALVRHFPTVLIAVEIGKNVDPPFEEELYQVRHAVFKRRAEYAAGRWAAYLATKALYCTPRPLLNDPERVPCWPTYLRGSIAHSDRIAIAMVARSEEIQAVGVDIEDDFPLAEELVSVVCTEAETERLHEWTTALRFDSAKLIFSAKEAFYKAHFPIFRTFFDFIDVEIVIYPGEGIFTARITKYFDENFLYFGQGRFIHVMSHIFSFVIYDHSSR